MNRRIFCTTVAASATFIASPRGWAHHGWSSFEESRPIYLAGTVSSVRWQNPHAELVLAVAPTIAIPIDLAQTKVPAQSANVDGAKLFASAVLPKKKGAWNVELAPLTRMQAWRIEPVKVGDQVAVLIFTYKDEAGAQVGRAEYLMVNGAIYGLRSSPAS